MASAYIKKLNGKSVIEIDGKIFNGATATVCTNRNGEIRVDEDYYRRLYDSGINLFFVMCDTDFSGKNGYENLCNEMKVIKKVAPNAYVILRTALHPTAEWVDKHPNAVVKYSDGKSRPAVIRQENGSVECSDGYALYSKEWKRDAGEALLDFISRLEKEDFSDMIVGYYLGAGSCSEWHNVAKSTVYNEEPYYDVGEDFMEEFQNYLDEKYGKGVKSPKLYPNEIKHDYVYFIEHYVYGKLGSPSTYKKTLPNIITKGTSVGTFLDINNYQDISDFYMALGYATANSLVYFAKLVKEKQPDKLIGAFFGYTNGVHLSMNLTGLSRVLSSGVVDFCAAPGCYLNRGLGGNEPVRSIRDTYNIHNMVFFSEDDTRTHLEPFSARSSYAVYTEEDSIDIIKRNFAKNFNGGNYSWWYDQQTGGGRFDSKGILDTFKAQSEIMARAGEKRWLKNNEIALILDIEGCVVNSNYSMNHSVMALKNYVLGKIGAGYDEYLLDDLESPDMPDYKLYIFSNTALFTDKQRASVTKKLQKNHATALWLYGAGFMNPDRENKLGVDHIKELTGVNVEMQEEVVYDGKFRICGDHEIVKSLKKRHDYGCTDEQIFSHQDRYNFYCPPFLSPRFTVNDDGATSLGLFNEEEQVAFAIKEYNGFNSVFCGVKYLQAEVIRSVAKSADCHIFSTDGDVMYFSTNFITIHSRCTGLKKIEFLEACSPFEVYENRYYGEKVKTIEFEMIEGQTKTFELK